MPKKGKKEERSSEKSGKSKGSARPGFALRVRRAAWPRTSAASVPATLRHFAIESSEMQHAFEAASGGERVPLPASVSAGDRARVHAAAEALQLTHNAVGDGAKRHIVLQRRSSGDDDDEPDAQDNDDDECDDDSVELRVQFAGGYIALVGAALDVLVVPFLDAVPDEWRKKRRQRDGTHAHHVTLLSKKDVARLKGDSAHALKVLQAHLSKAARKAKADSPLLELLGVGSARDGNNVATFAVLNCAALDAARDELHLPKQDFHVTLGFAHADIHDVAKDASTLMGDDLERIAAKFAKLAI